MAEYAWSCLQCPARGTGPKFDLEARKHEAATKDQHASRGRAVRAREDGMSDMGHSAEKDAIVPVNGEGIESPPRRCRATSEPDSGVTVYATFRGVTLADVIEATKHVDPATVSINGGMHWPEDANDDDRARWAEAQRKHDERHEKWERETYERLRAKYEQTRVTPPAEGDA